MHYYHKHTHILSLSLDHTKHICFSCRECVYTYCDIARAYIANERASAGESDIFKPNEHTSNASERSHHTDIQKTRIQMHICEKLCGLRMCTCSLSLYLICVRYKYVLSSCLLLLSFGFFHFLCFVFSLSLGWVVCLFMLLLFGPA